MKIRNGFVSNSSSSSFIISSDKDKELVIKLNLEEYCTVVTNEAELRKLEYFEYEDEEDLKDNKIFQNCLKELANGKVIKYLDSNSDDYDNPTTILRNLNVDKSLFSGNIKIILDGN